MKNGKKCAVVFSAVLCAQGLCEILNADELDSQNPVANSAGSSYADSEISESVKLNRSVVTATGFKQDIKDAPASISIITGEEVVERPMRDLGEVVQNIPGVEVEATKTGDTNISMRGLGSNYTLILIDGKRQNVNTGFHANGYNGFQTGMMPPPSMIERIEVLRGPASVVWGSEAMGGVINIITKKNLDKLTASLMLETTFQEHNLDRQSKANANEYGSWGNMHGINGSIAAPIIKDILSLSIRGNYRASGRNELFSPLEPRTTNGRFTGPGNPYTSWSAGAYTTKNIGARLNLTPNKNHNFYIDGEFNDRDTGTLNTSSTQMSAYHTFRKENYVLAHDYTGEKFDTSTYFQFMRTQRIPHLVNSPYFNAEPDSFVLDFDNRHPDNNYKLRVNKNYIFDSKIHKGIDLGTAGFLNINGGVYYMHETYRNYGSALGLRKQNQYAVYAEGDWAISEMWSVDLGARYNYSELYVGTINPRAYVIFSPTRILTLKAGVTSGMMVPSIDTLDDGLISERERNGTEGTYGNKDLQAEKSWNYELSAIVDTGSGFFTLSGFLTNYVDKVASISYANNQNMQGGIVCAHDTCSQYQNVDKSKVYGVEASYDLNLKKLDFNLNYTFADSEQLSGANKGKPVNSIPRHTINSKITYKFTKDFNSYLRVQYKAQRYISTSNSVSTANNLYGEFYKPYSVVDLGANYRLKDGVTLSAMVNNLLDTNFAHLDVWAAGTSNAAYSNRYGLYQPGRNVWMSLKMDF